MTSSFNVHDASGYEQLMGRWSQRLALPFIDFAGLADGEKILDVGCGTGSLTFALARTAESPPNRGDRLFAGVRRGGDPAQHRPADQYPAGGCLRTSLRRRDVRPRVGVACAPFHPGSRQGGSRDAPRRAARWRGRSHRLGSLRRHVGDAHDDRHGGDAQRCRAPVSQPLLLSADDGAGRNEADIPRARSGRRYGNAADDPHGLPELRRLLGARLPPAKVRSASL